MGFLFSRVGGYLMAGLALLGAVFAIFRQGKKSARVDGMAQQLGNVEKANEIENTVRTNRPDTNRERLHNEWSRD